MKRYNENSPHMGARRRKWISMGRLIPRYDRWDNLMTRRMVPMIPLLLGGVVFIIAAIILLLNFNDETAIRVFLPATAFFIFTAILHILIKE